MYENNVFETLNRGDVAAVAGHISPDGDAVSSVFAFSMALAQHGVIPLILLEEYPDRFNYLRGAEYLYKGDKESLSPKFFFALDCGDKERLGEAAKVFDRAEITYNIDHHISNNMFAQYNIVNPKASSASEVVYEIIRNKCEITADIAEAIYSGIVFDTSGFKHNSTSQRTHEIAGELVEMGVDTAFIHSKVLYEHTASQVKVMGCAINNFRMFGDIAYSTLTKTELDMCGAKSGDTDGIVEYLLNIDGVQVSALLTERDGGKVKISLRSKKYNVNNVASSFGGGGHILAAGATSDLPMEETLDKLISRIKEEETNG